MEAFVGELTRERLSGKTKSDSGVDVEGVLLRYMTDWDSYLPQVMGAYNSTQHYTTEISPHMMLTGDEKSLPLNFFYPENEGAKRLPQVFVRDVVRRQQELNEL